ncbi:hypothetical protein Tco_1215397 [Tanacetum coccineum]
MQPSPWVLHHLYPDFPEDFDWDLVPLDEPDCDSLALGPLVGSASLPVFLFFNPRSDPSEGSCQKRFTFIYFVDKNLLQLKILSDAERKFMNSSLVAPSLTDAKSGCVDGGFVASVVGGGVDVDCCNGGVKDGNDCEMTVENTGEESEITETGTVMSVGVCWLGTS